MKTHLESVSDFAAKEVIDEWLVFRCNKGHRWEETLENQFDIAQPLHFPVLNGRDICPFCFGELLNTLGKVSVEVKKNG